MKSDKIYITYGRTSSDETSEYIINYPKGMTVREFINEQLADEREWGFFGIYCADQLWFERGNPYCEYRHGKIITEPFSDDILDSVIKDVSGSGGWSRSDFKFII